MPRWYDDLIEDSRLLWQLFSGLKQNGPKKKSCIHLKSHIFQVRKTVFFSS